MEILEHKNDYDGAIQWIERAETVAREELKDQIEDLKRKDLLRKGLSQVVSLGDGVVGTGKSAVQVDKELMEAMQPVGIAFPLSEPVMVGAAA